MTPDRAAYGDLLMYGDTKAPPRLRRARIVFSLVVLLVGPAWGRSDVWPQWLGPQRDGVWREQGILKKFPEGGPRQRWRTPIGAGYSGPAVAAGRVYVTDRLADALARDPFAKERLAGKERVLCLDEVTGKELWKHEYDCAYEVSYPLGPRTTPLVHGEKVYTLGTMGDLKCLETASGKVVWEKNFVRDFDARVPLWGFASNPLLDGDKLICLCGGPGSAVIAFHKDTGKELWRSLTAEDIGYSPPVIFTVGQTRQLIAWLPNAVNSLDPETGKRLWSQPFAIKAGLTAPMPRMTGDLLFVTSFYNGSMMLRLDPKEPKAQVVWKG